MLNPVWGFFLRSWFQRQHKVSRCGPSFTQCMKAQIAFECQWQKRLCIEWWPLQVVWDHHRIIKGIPSEDHTSLAAGYVCILCHESGDQWSWGSCVRVSVNTGNWPGATHWIRSADSITTIITDITVTIIPLLLVLAARPRHSKKNLVFTGARLMSNPRAIIVFVHFALNVPQYPGQYQ